MRRFPNLTATVRITNTAPTNSSFFNPSYRSLARPNLLLSSSVKGKARLASGNRSCSSSSWSSSGNSRGKAIKTTAATISSPASTTTTPTIPTTAATTTPPQPLAPLLPHASPSLISLDAFFALDRPLLELPIRLSARKSTQVPFARLSPLAAALEDANEEEIRALQVEEMEDLEIDSEELVEVVDLSADGTPLGPSYITTLASTSAGTNISSPVRLQAELEAAEAAMKELEESEGMNGFEVDPYEPWLISEPDSIGSAALSPALARYLASRSPFVPPPAPLSFVSTSSSINPARRPLSTSSLHSPQTVADLSFLRPFASPAPATSTASPSILDPTANALFAEHFANPLPPSLSQAITDRFLSASSLSHRWRAQVDYATDSGEALELARRMYAGEDTQVRRSSTGVTVGRTKRRGELRTWSAEEGWKVVDLSKSSPDDVGGSPFLPAEMVDLDWADEDISDEESKSREFTKRQKWSDRICAGPRILAERGGRIGMDSTKRKRKKKITKHKFKKRRYVARSFFFSVLICCSSHFHGFVQ
jgi:hypothetical protein